MVAYISRVQYPDPAANSVQTIQMAAALAQLEEHTFLFVHDLAAPEEQIRRDYGIDRGGLKFWPLRTQRWPGLIYNHAMLRFLTYNSSVAAILGFHPAWRRLSRECKVLFVRSRLEILYWGLLRPYLPWMRDWLFVCEIHDLSEGENAVNAAAPSRDALGEKGEAAAANRARRMVQALSSYDLVITVNQALADDLNEQSHGRIEARVAPLCSGMARLPEAPVISLPDDRVVMGYFGTIDLAHGIDTAIRALEFLPKRYMLRLTGRIREDARAWVDAAIETGRVEWVGPVPYAQMAAEIDACHVALVPAGSTVHATRYRSPLKIFDAMLRGKVIVAADVSCHRELLCDGENAVLFLNADPQDLADKVLALTKDLPTMQNISRAAWQASGAYTYPARAQTLFALMEEARLRKQR